MTRRGSCWLTVGPARQRRRRTPGDGLCAEPGGGSSGRYCVDHGLHGNAQPASVVCVGGDEPFRQPEPPGIRRSADVRRVFAACCAHRRGCGLPAGQTLGSAQLDAAIKTALETPGNNAVVYGYSESSSIATQEMINIAALPPDQQYDPANLQFILVEDLNNPDGGFLERLPFLAGTPFPATPADTPYDTSIYTVEYSGSSDFPEYPSDLMADENAAAGFVDLHPLLLPGWPTSFDPSSLAGSVLEPTSAGYDGNTEYFMVPTQDLPLLDSTRDLGGSAFADLIQPDMRVIVDLGYNWTGGADVVTPADMTSPPVDTTAVDAYLAAGADQGIIAALVDSGILPQADLSGLYPYVPDVAGLDAGALTNDAAALTDASSSASALMSDLAASSSPLAPELSSFLPGLATDLADSFATYLNFPSL